MKKPSQSLLRSERGSALIAAAMISLLLLSGTLWYVEWSHNRVRSDVHRLVSGRVMKFAESGIDRAMMKLREPDYIPYGQSRSFSIDEENGRIDVYMTRTSTSNINLIEATSTAYAFFPRGAFVDPTTQKTCQRAMVKGKIILHYVGDYFAAVPDFLTVESGGDLSGGSVYSKNLIFTPPKLPTDVASHWKFDENSGVSTLDSSGSNNTGILTNGPIWTAGPSSPGLSFDGTDDYVATANNTPLDFGETDSFTVSAWIKTTVSSDRVIISKEDASSAQGWGFYVEPGCVRVHVTNNWAFGNKIVKCSASDAADGAWHHVAFTYNGSSDASGVNIYVDGNLSNGVTFSNNLTGTIHNTTRALIGAYPGPGGFFNGKMDEIKVYNRALAATEISDLYHNVVAALPSTLIGNAYYIESVSDGTTNTESPGGVTFLNPPGHAQRMTSVPNLVYLNVETDLFYYNHAGASGLMGPGTNRLSGMVSPPGANVRVYYCPGDLEIGTPNSPLTVSDFWVVYTTGNVHIHNSILRGDANAWVGIIAQGAVVISTDAPNNLELNASFVTNGAFRADPPNPPRPKGSQLTFNGGFLAHEGVNLTAGWPAANTTRIYTYHTIYDPRFLLPNFTELVEYHILQGKYGNRNN